MIYTLCIALTILSRPPAYSQRAGPAIKQELAIIQEGMREVITDIFYFHDEEYLLVREFLEPLTVSRVLNGPQTQRRSKGFVS